ncbi:MAG: tRNA epoxyqueuosine(34) reductase QueG [Clostridia bacterium]|nr:tRNA epoxyqueuosine(34) reductase QueG [Clostridia bacterium]
MDKNRLLQFTTDIGLDYVGVSNAEILEDVRVTLVELRKKQTPCPFEEADIEKRSNPFLILPEAKSIITCLFPYYMKELIPENLSRYAAVCDYHKVAKEKLGQIAAFITKETGEKCFTFTDNSPLPDRMLAYRAGLGFFGKNRMLIHPEIGSYFFIGSVITTAYFPPDAPLELDCLNCNRCLEACPGGALSEDGFDFVKCISYLTQAKNLTKEQEDLLKKQTSAYGCDVCQEVCPHNENLADTALPEFLTETLLSLDKEEIEEMSNRKFCEKYKNFPFIWRGRSVIARNLGQKELDKFCD